MGAESNAKPPPPNVVMLDKALKLVLIKARVNNMSTSGACDHNEVECEVRPSRLDLGARVTPKAKTAVTLDPVERKLLGKLNSRKKSISDNVKTSLPKDDPLGEEDDSEPESRTRAFQKKRPMPQAPLLSIKRKR